jgi:hypothetical protein
VLNIKNNIIEEVNMVYSIYVNNQSGAIRAFLVEGEITGNSVKQKYLGRLGFVIYCKKSSLGAVSAVYTSIMLNLYIQKYLTDQNKLE